MLAIIYWMARWGLGGDSPLLIGQVLAVSWFLLLLPPALVAHIRWRGGEDRPQWYLTQPALALLALAVLVVAGFVADRAGVPFGGAFSLCGVGLFVWILASMGSSVRKHPFVALAAIAGTLVFSALIAGQVWAAGYLSPLFLEKVALGAAHRDTLFHSSISSMIRTYGIPSTGLNGLPILHYHLGSHWLIAWLSALVRVSPLDFYQLGYPVILVPLFLQSLLGFVSSVSERMFGRPIRFGSKSGIAVWLVLGLAFASVLPRAASFKAGLWGIVVSESYLVGMTLFFLTAWLLVGRFAGRRDSRLGTADKALLILALPVLLALIGFAKISILILSAVLLSYMWLRYGLFRDRFLLMAAGICAVVAVATYAMVSPSGGTGGGGISFLPFIRENVTGNSSGAAAVLLAVWFLIGHFFWSWLYAVLRLRQLDVTSVARLREIWRDRLATDVEAVALICVIGALPGMLVAIPGGSAYYFSGIQQWLSVGLLMGMIPSLAPFEGGSPSRTGGTVPSSRIAWIVASLMCFAVLASALFWGGEFAASQGSTRAGILAAAGEPTPPLVRPVLSQLRAGDFAEARTAIEQRVFTPGSALDRNPRYQLIMQLRNVANTSASEKRKTAVYIPRSNMTYWGMLPGFDVAFVAPAMTEVAAMDGLPQEPPAGLMYGFATYDWPRRTLSAAEASAQAARLGFDRLVVFDGQQLEGRAVGVSEPK